MGTDFIATHDRTHSDYQTQWDTLVPQGYRPISLSAYGSVADPRYAAVWLRRGGPRFVGIHGATASQFQVFFDTWAAQGFSPTILTATGPTTSPIFACVMEESDHGVSLTRHGLRSGDPADSGTLEHWIGEARTNDWIPRWIATYGDASDRRFAIVLDPNLTHVLWSIAGWWGEDHAAYQRRFDAHVQQWARPAFITVAPDATYLSVFRDDSIGPWVARHGMTSGQYQQEFDRWVATGMFPVYVQGGGSGSGTRFAALFAERDVSLKRRFTITGRAVANMRALDDVAERFMRSTGTRGTGVAVTKGGRLVFARGYTWAEPDYTPIEPTSMFRIASCTKPITSIVIHRLLEDGLLSLNDSMQAVLGLAPAPGGALDPRLPNVRILNLLTHTGGWDRMKVSDLATPDVVATAYGLPFLPVTKRELAGYMAGRPLQFAPGAEQEYSNLGYLLLGLIVERKSGDSYIDTVVERVFRPLGLTRPHRTLAAAWAQRPGTVRHHDIELRVVPSAVSGPAQGPRPLVPLGYGGEDLGQFDSFGGWCMAPVDYAKILAAFALGAASPLLRPTTVATMWTVPAIYQTAISVELPGYTNGWNSWTESSGIRAFQHGGAMPGVSSQILYRTDGWGFAVFSNGSEGVPDVYPPLTSMQPQDWPKHDLFPSVGIPAFSRAALRSAVTMGKKPLPDRRPDHIRTRPIEARPDISF
jgi:CubicO group peptidase (beta-lactamase class C family)